MNPRLLAISGMPEGTTFALTEDEVSIGREASNRIAISDRSVSRLHCVIRGAGGVFKVVDAESFNATFVNGVPVKECVLKHGDRIALGNVLFIFLLEEAGDSAPGDAALFDDGLVALSMTTLERADARHLFQQLATGSHLTARVERDFDALLRISTELHALRDPEGLQRYLLEAIWEILPAERGAIILCGEHSGTVDSAISKHDGPDGEPPMRVSRTVAEQVLREGVAILCDDIGVGGTYAETESLAASQVSALLCVPLTIGERTAGFIYLDTCNPAAPFDQGHLRLLAAVAGIASVALENAKHLEWLRGENQRLRQEIHLEHEMIGEGARMREVYRLIERFAAADATVLIRGESGTGKELAAHAIHASGARADKPFVAINCAVLTEALLESELFGHEKGAFTGAVAQKRGKLEVADGGTLFLDEVGELAPPLQAKLLRVLEERAFERVGGTRVIKVDLRVIAATNRHLEEAVKSGAFRQDLYYRLNVVSLTMPPLRERREDIPLLVDYFTAKYSQKCKRPVLGISPEARSALSAYDWPGNVRELANAIERAVVVGQTELITLEDLPETLIESGPGRETAPNFYERIKGAKRRLILEAVTQAEGNLTEAARILGIHPANLHRLIRNMNLRSSLRG